MAEVSLGKVWMAVKQLPVRLKRELKQQNLSGSIRPNE